MITPNAGMDAEKQDDSNTAGGNIKWKSHLGVSYKTYHITQQLYLGIYLKEMKIMFIQTLCTEVQSNFI